MIFIYDECHQIMREAVRLYAERFLDRVHPSVFSKQRIVQIFQKIGSVDKIKNVNESRKQRIKKSTY